jgi:hypothetical protein
MKRPMTTFDTLCCGTHVQDAAAQLIGALIVSAEQ